MEPIIYKPGAYKTPGVYKGAGGIYKGRGVYNDGSDEKYIEIAGRVYPIVKIGKQKWLAENLDLKLNGIDIGIAGEPLTPAAWYYNNNESYYGENGLKYGLLYNWYAIGVISNSGLLPNGWRVPDINDFNNLFNEIGGANQAYNKLAGAWAAGGDIYGFNAPPSGARWNGNFGRQNMSFYMYCSTEYDTNNAGRMWIDPHISGFDNAILKKYAQSLRLVKD